MIKQKRGSILTWVIAIIILAAIGVGIYFLLTGDASSASTAAGSISSPPALPS